MLNPLFPRSYFNSISSKDLGSFSFRKLMTTPYRLGRATEPSSVSLSIMLEGSSEKPRQIDSVDKFKGDFGELWLQAITPTS